MDFITLDEMKIFGHTGVLPEEKKNGQFFYVTAVIGIDRIRGCITDKLDDTVNYDEISKIIRREVEESSCDLIEYLAGGIASRILGYSDMISKCTVEVSKPDAPVEGEFKTMKVRIERERHTAFLSLGTNMGDRPGNLTEAVSKIKNCREILKSEVSSVYETEPVGYDDQDDFLNCCVKLDTLLSPYELLEFAHSIENDLHRERNIRFGPRTMDVDILLYDSITSEDEKLIIPHPRMYERAFVLVPLHELGAYEGEIPGDKAVKLWGKLPV